MKTRPGINNQPGFFMMCRMVPKNDLSPVPARPITYTEELSTNRPDRKDAVNAARKRGSVMNPTNAINSRSPTQVAAPQTQAAELAQPPPAARPDPNPAVQGGNVNPTQAPEFKQVQDAVEELRQTAASLDIKLNFEINGDHNRIVVKVVNGDTGKVIREIPSKEMLRLADRIAEMNHGLLFDSRA